MKDMSNLVIVESPTKAKTLSRFLGKGYQIEATMGHIRDLPEKKLGIIIKTKELKNQKTEEPKNSVHKFLSSSVLRSQSYEFIPQYQIISGRKQKVSELKKLAENTPSVILATDPDREGEAIAWHIKYLLTQELKNQKTEEQKTDVSKFLSSSVHKFQRIVFHEITQSAIKHALDNPRDIDMQLVDAQQARRILDRLVGYKLSPLLWNKLGKRWLSAGRVQSVAVRLIVEREREILVFKPQEYWVIEVELTRQQVGHPERSEGSLANASSNKSRDSSASPQNDKVSFLSRLEKINDKKADLANKELADKVVEDLKSAKYQVSNVEVKDARRYPAPPFTTSTLQQAAANKFAWTAKRTMRTAQSLYEEGYITYHRTDSTNLSLEAINMVRGYINNVYGKSYLPDAPKFYKTKSKVAQEAHEAVRPTAISEITNYKLQITNKLGRDAGILYELIWKRFVASQMNEAVIEQTEVLITATQNEVGPRNGLTDQYLLKAHGERMKFDGWFILYGNNVEKELPKLTIGEDLDFLNILPQQKFTEPPARYTEATLIKALEEKGIGRPSTYAPIISTIQDRKYVTILDRKKFAPTDLGFAVNDFLVKYFPDVFDVSFTARMEDELDEIANGNMDWNSVVGDFYAPFKVKIDEVFKEADRVKVDLGTTDEKCPKCSSVLVYRLSKYGKFLACSNYPKCTFTKSIIEKIEIPCPRCGADIVVKRTRRGKQFYGCSNWPKCNFAAWKKEDIK